jgi:hypothetical protein
VIKEGNSGDFGHDGIFTYTTPSDQAADFLDHALGEWKQKGTFLPEKSGTPPGIKIPEGFEHRQFKSVEEVLKALGIEKDKDYTLEPSHEESHHMH